MNPGSWSANPPDLLGEHASPATRPSAPETSPPTSPALSPPTYCRPSSATTRRPVILTGKRRHVPVAISTDSLTWNDIPGATAQDLPGALVGPLTQKTFIRRIIGGDACILAGAADQVVTVRIIGVTAQVTNVTCNRANNGSITAQSDGQPPFSYQWSSGQTTQTITGLTQATTP